MNEADKETLERIHEAMRHAGFAWWEMELPSGVVFFDETKTRVLGYKAKDFVHYSHFTALLHPEDKDIAMQAMYDHINGKAEFYEVIYRIKGSDGKYHRFYDKGRIVEHKGKEMRVMGLVMDLSGSQLSKAVDKV